jgi:probable H4MPT-linked C1 transfer pathway protein
MPSVLGLDIGGANLKAAHTSGVACLRPFELWKTPNDLAIALRDLLKEMPKADLLAVTMTGELCDCFETKREGVSFILKALVEAADQIPTRVWTTSGTFASLEEANSQPLKTASANWLALATFVGRYVPVGPGMLIDIGSTTADLVPLLDGKPVPGGRTDPERLRCRELVYTGIRRTPVCALLGGAGAAELFATTLDVYLLLGELSENADDWNTADGRPATREAARARLARMMGADSETFSMPDAVALAQVVFNRHVALLHDSIRDQIGVLSGHPEAVVISGSGEFLARKVLDNVKAISLADKLGPEISQSACAYAVAVLAQESIVNQP